MDAHPQISDPFSREILEFPAIAAMLAPYLSASLSKPILAAIEPHAQLTEIWPALDAAREACDFLTESPRPILGGLDDPRPQLESLSVEGVCCSALEILAVVELARAACNWRELFAKTSYPALGSLAGSIPGLHDLVSELYGKILPGGSVDSSASPALARIRRLLEQTRLELHSKLERILRRLGQDGLLQEDLLTLRNGRFVLPVKADKKRQVQGVVHGASSSGQSVFVEPLETLPLNNELVELEDKETAEIQRVLGEFSRSIRARRQELLEAARLLSELDLAFAKAEFARQYGACIPEFTNTPELVLREARHPLLVRALRPEGRDCIPLTIELGARQRLVIISGPNTGGKTVAMKTVGAAVLMAQSGLPVTAKEARLPLFGRVLADIGDQQSIEQNLSTFSAHIRNIQAMVEVADAGTLALLDEIGSSTDPDEGSALAVAILEHFRNRGSMVFVSTHHSRVKAYATVTPEAMNAAMDFNESTLEPAYRFLPGLPGKSSGLDIARRLGLDPGIVEQARERLGAAHVEASALVAALHAKREEMESAMEAIRQQSRDLEAREARLKREMAAERQAKLGELDKRLEATLRDYNEKWRAAIEEIRRQMQSGTQSARMSGRSTRRAETLARDARNEWNMQALDTLGQAASSEEAPNDGAVVVGDRVRLPDLSVPGTVTAILPDNRIEVEVGRLRMKIPRDGVHLLSHLAPGDAGRTNLAPHKGQEARPESNLEFGVPAEIDVIGSTAEEARDQVDKFLDNSFLAGRFRVRIIHGHGKGILRKSLHDMFASHPHVDNFYPAPRHEGGEGATVVELKK